MNRNGQLILGALLLLAGALFLAGELFQVNLWAFCFPVGLIALGLILMFRERIFPPGSGASFHPLGDIRRRDAWQVRDETIYLFVGDIKLDLRTAEVPPGLSTMQAYGFVGSVDVIAPADVGVELICTAFVTDADLWGNKADYFLNPVERRSPGYETTNRQVRLVLAYFIADLDFEQVQSSGV